VNIVLRVGVATTILMIAAGCSRVCTPECAGKACGDDGCGGACGTCAAGYSCGPAGVCEAACAPDCIGRACGADGCGGVCGTCAAGRSCSAAGECVDENGCAAILDPPWCASYQTPEFPASQRDEDSWRSCVAGTCGWTEDGSLHTRLIAVALCDYTETCDWDNPACVSCGRLGRRTAQATKDGVLVVDALGCKGMGGWTVYGCYLDASPYYGFSGPFVDLVWQSGVVLRFAVTPSGQAYATGFDPTNDTVASVGVSITEMIIAPGGNLELSMDVVMTHRDTYGVTHDWHITGTIVDSCP
jgi:hypothetical protein